jgi:hypothetical protein
MLATTLTHTAAEPAPATRGDDAAELQDLIASGLVGALTEDGF